jgi:eukaryotic-like serine/threonine-protein kinase
MAHEPREPGSLVGTTIGGVYKMRRLIGAGGMGEVYAADRVGGQEVAIKVLNDKAARDKDLLARFDREAAVAAQIKSSHIAAILGSGKGPDGRPWIAFELLSGEGLDERLRREQYLSFADVAPIVNDALQGLADAHRAGVIHRDIKPANLFIEKRPAPGTSSRDADRGRVAVHERTRILDFGVSKVRPPKGSRRKSEPSLTAYDATLGSFAYMAPEQVRGSARVDERADLYALGAVAFRALSGRLPFEGHNALTLIALKLDRDPPTLSETTGDEWPGPIERFLSRMMARTREGRFAGATEALVAWRSVCRQMGDLPRRRPRTLPARGDEAGDATAPTFTGSLTGSISKAGGHH